MTSDRVKWGLLAYFAMAALAVVWGFVRGVPNVFVYQGARPWFEFSPPIAQVLSLVAGTTVGLTTVAVTRWLVVRAAWARKLEQEFRSLVGPLTGAQVLLLAGGSALAEEMFFRGALVPTIGLWVSTLVFALVHRGPSREFLPWTIWAGVMGLVFGSLFVGTGQLIGPIVAHALINGLNLRKLATEARTAPLPYDC